MLKTIKKQNIIKEYKIHDTDSGSPEVQIALLSEQIKKLASHLKKHEGDNHSRRGLLKMVARRKKLTDYLRGKDEKRYKKLIKDLGLRK